MFEIDDIKLYGIVGILAVIVIGYFVFLMYNDLLTIKHQLKSSSDIASGSEYSPSECSDDSEHEHEEFEDDLEDDYSDHLDTVFDGMPDTTADVEEINEINEINEVPIKQEPDEQVDEIQVVEPVATIKKRAYRKKNSE